MEALRRLLRHVLIYQLRRLGARVRRQRNQLRCLERALRNEQRRHWRSEAKLRHQYNTAQERANQLQVVLASVYTVADAGDLDEVRQVTHPFACAQGVSEAQRFVDGAR